MTLRKTIVSNGLKTLRSAGVFKVAANSERRRKRLLILCYHGLSLEDEHEWLPNLYITPQQFRDRLQGLRDMKANVLPLGEALALLHRNALPPRSVSLTFDDGFFDFYRHALPAVKKFAYPCTLYLTTHYCGRPLPVITLFLDYLLWKSKLSVVELADFGVAGRAPIRNYPERQHVVRSVLAWMTTQQLNTAEKNEAAVQIAKQLGVDVENIMRKRMLQIVSKEEAVELARAGIDLQLHTHRHQLPKDRVLFRREILDNSNALFELTGKEAVHFCYPSGFYVPEFLPWLKELGIKSATTCERGLARPDSPDLTLPRMLDDVTVDPIRFESFVAGILE